jgi:predicted nucleic acid-binding protein
VVIVLDANVILRALTLSDDPQVRRANDLASALFRQVARGDIEVTTSDAVLAEAAFILTAKSHYHLPVAEAAAKLAALVSLPGFKLPDKRSIVLALDFWTANPRLGFVDALVAVHAQRPGMLLATFDSDFDGLPGITRWKPPGTG